jgi:isochorismate synthase
MDKEVLTRSVSNISLRGILPEAVLRMLLNFAFHEKIAIAIWKLPYQDKIQCILDTSTHFRPENIDLEVMNSGFIVSPFNNHHQSSYFIKNIISFDMDENLIQLHSHYQEGMVWIQKLKEYISENLNAPIRVSNIPKLNNERFHNTPKEDFIEIVKSAVKAIKNDEFQKVVPSKLKSITLPEGFDLWETYHNLCNSYEHAFVSLVSVPQVGTWVGASPETLISVDKNNIFRTVSLAGTQVKEEGQKEADISWRQKEIEEQAMVSRYIVNCFKKIRLREFEEIGPRTVTAGNLIHLKTDFIVDIKAIDYPRLGSTMLKLLHPTSAVCGMPKEAATAFLEKHEKHDRSFFSGYLGPVNVDKETHLYVNLRCMQLSGNQAVLFAGAGVTEGSDPEKEWIETEMKCKTLLQMMQT